MQFTELFIIIVLTLAIFMYIKQYYGEVTYVRSSVDGREYLVRALPDKQRAADMIANVNKRLTSLVHHMVAKYPDDADVTRLYDNYNPEAVSEGGQEAGYTSYSINKGERIVLCVRQPDNTIVGINVLMYVAIHELGHLMSASVGHNDEFWGNFKKLLQESIDIGIYEKVDYASNPHSYCGIHISSSVI